MTELHLLNHIGGHVDAPAHQIAGGDTSDGIPLECFVTHTLTINAADCVPGPLLPAAVESCLPRAQAVVAPIKLAAGNGGPARILALLPDAP
jgi:kynurenine formamidase